MFFIEVLNRIVLGNTIQKYLLALLVFLVLWLFFKIIQKVVLLRLKRIAERTVTDIDNTLIDIVDKIRPAFYMVLALYASTRTLILTGVILRAIHLALIIVLSYQVISSLQILFDYIVRKRLQSGDDKDDLHAKAAADMIGMIIKVVLWSIGLLFILSNIGVNVTSLVASLGIGGIAIALAVQNILNDLFSSLAIYLDKPFVVGDTIKIGDVVGKVKSIGIKTTRLQSLAGEEVVFSNKEITNAQVRNFRRMKERRTSFSLNVSYDTSVEKLRTIPKLIEDVVSNVENIRFQRCFFSEFASSALVFETSFYVTNRDYSNYVKARQEINLMIKKALDDAGIALAYPTQTIQLKQL